MVQPRNNQSSYKDLITWQKGIELVTVVYQLVDQLPEKEKFGLCSQFTRAAISVPSNIAEGYRRGKKEYAQFLLIASGSIAELETHCIIAQNIYNVDTSLILNCCNELGRLLYVTRSNLIKRTD